MPGGVDGHLEVLDQDLVILFGVPDVWCVDGNGTRRSLARGIALLGELRVASGVLAAEASHPAGDLSSALVGELAQSEIVGSGKEARHELRLDRGILSIADMDPATASGMAREGTHAEELALDTCWVADETAKDLQKDTRTVLSKTLTHSTQCGVEWACPARARSTCSIAAGTLGRSP